MRTGVRNTREWSNKTKYNLFEMKPVSEKGRSPVFKE